MAGITLEELLKEVGVCPEKVNDSISDDHLREIALILPSWKTIAQFLGLEENDLDAIEQEEKKDQVMKLKALQKWKGKFGFKATYKKLVEVLLQLAKADIAEKVLLLLKDSQRAEKEAIDVQLQEKNAEIEKLKRDLQALKGDKGRLQAEVEAKDAEVDRQQREIETLKEDKGRLQAEVEAKKGQIQQQGTELEEGVNQLNKRQRELQTLREDRGRLQSEVDAKNAEIDRQQREIQTLREDRGRLQAKFATRPGAELALEEKDAEIKRQQRELQTLRNQNATKDKRLAAVQSQLQQLQAEMDTRSAKFKQQIRERDAEINTLQKELRDETTSEDESVAAMQSPSKKQKLCSPSELRLTCRRLPDMPETLDRPIAVTVDTVVYMTRRYSSHDIHRYDPQTQQWTNLPKYQCWDFTMTEVNNQLTLVGGNVQSTTSTRTTVTDAVAVYSTSQGWTQPYPPMNTPRANPAVSTYHQHLVVAGGSYLATVEILDTSTSNGQWLSITSMSLPEGCSQVSSAIVHDTLYLLGGSLGKKIYSMSLPALTQTDKPPAQWCTLPDTPLDNSAAIAVHGSLLAVGGKRESGGRRSYTNYSSVIHVYDQEKNMWTKFGDLPTARSSCACCLLPGGKILIAGGEDSNGLTKRMDMVVVTVWD